MSTSPDDPIFDGGVLPEVVITGTAAPGGLSWSRFKALSADVGSWLWGTVQGAFNEKASFSQILVDAVIGMIPLVGDVTAARDLIAVAIRLIDDPQAREDTWEWVLLVVLVLALIPVVGGVIKGVGRLLCKIFKSAAKLSDAARAAHLAEGAQEVIEFLNRIGMGNAERWLLRLKFADYQAQILEHFAKFMNTMSDALGQIREKMGRLMPVSLGRRIDGLRTGISELKAKGQEMIPRAVRELDQYLRELQSYVRSGGETTSRLALHRTATGQRTITRAEEARLIEDGVLPVRSARGGWKQNSALTKRPQSWKKYYTPEPGYPDLTKRKSADGRSYPAIAAYSGRMVNRRLKDSEEIYRLFGKSRTTHGITIDETYPGGSWWGIGASPQTAEEWRGPAAVLDEFNGDGYIVTGKVVGANGPKAVVGTVSEQAGTKIPGQYLPGGATQAFFFMDAKSQAELNSLGERVIATGKPIDWIDPVSGIEFQIKPTGWTDANGVWGYFHVPGAGTVQTSRLGAREMASKDNEEVVVTP